MQNQWHTMESELVRKPITSLINFRNQAVSEGSRRWWRSRVRRKQKRREQTGEAGSENGEREDFNFNLRVTEFTDICTRIRLAVPHSFSEKSPSLLSVLKTYSSSDIQRRTRPFTVLKAEKKKKEEKKRQQSKLDWKVLNSRDACLTICNPHMSPRCLLYIVCILMEKLTRGEEGKKKERKKWRVTSDSFELSTCHLQHIQTSRQPRVFPRRRRWPRS